MSSRVERVSALPALHLWFVLAVILAVGVAGNWPLAAGLLLVFLLHRVRPFDIIAAYLLVVAGAAFVKNSGGGLTMQLGLLVSVILLMLVCYALRSPERLISIPRTPMTWPLLLFMLLTLANAARGLAWNGARYMGLELLPLLALGSALLVANVFDPRRDMGLAILGLIVIGYASAVRGFPESSRSLHAENTYILAVPGLVGLLLINLALRSERQTHAIGWTLLALPLFLEQLVTFGRGLWTGGLAGLVFSFFVYGGWGAGARERWARCGLLLGTIFVLGLLGVVQLAVFLGHQDLLQEVTARWATTTSTKINYETRSNFIRLWEYATAIGQIRTSPWIGHGLGFAFLNKEPFTGRTFDQWYVHERYLMVWLKQGVIGLLLFVWVLWRAIWMGAREGQRRADPWIGAWFATTGAATVFQAVFALSNFPFGIVNEMFLLALLWGGSMAMTRTGFVVFRWRPPSAEMVEMPRTCGAPAPIDPPS